jgi:predicted nuclease with TOPRIM domain
MDGMNEQIQRIEGKALQLVNKYNLAQKEIQRLQKENQLLKEQLQSYNEQAAKLNQKTDAFKINEGNLKSTSKSELEKRIDIYLKDIERCLALLHS